MIRGHPLGRVSGHCRVPGPERRGHQAALASRHPSINSSSQTMVADRRENPMPSSTQRIQARCASSSLRIHTSRHTGLGLTPSRTGLGRTSHGISALVRSHRICSTSAESVEKYSNFIIPVVVPERRRSRAGHKRALYERAPRGSLADQALKKVQTAMCMDRATQF